MGQELRPYQQQARDRIHAEWDAGHTRTLLVLPTGTGKTIVFASVAADQVRAGDRVLILAHRGELLEQAADKLQRSTGLVSAVEKAESTCLDSWFRVVVGSVQTLQRTARLERFPRDYFGTIIIDEAHHAITDGYRRILDYFSGAKVLGVTATPDRGDMRNLGEVFDSLAFEYKLTDAIKEGYLCRIMAQTIPLQLDITSVTMSGGDYAVGDLGTALDPYLEQIAAEMARRCKSRKTVVFLPLIKTSQKFRDLLNTYGFRAAEVNGQSDDRRQVLADFDAGKYNVLCNSMLLTEMDGFEGNNGVIILAATNRPESLDPALTRPGRFDRRVPVELPDLKGREEILKVHAKKIALAPGVDFSVVARMASGASGAELANIVNEAALRAVRAGRKSVTQADLEESIEVVIAGYQKKNSILTDKEKCIVAYHEIGHALVAAKQTHSAPVQKITIIPRTSGALGFTMQVEEGNHYLMDKTELENKIATLTGGRAAEEVAFGSITTGASNDIEQATKLARAMLTRYGMSDEFDMVALETVNNQYLGGDTSLACSAQTQREIDQKVVELVRAQHQKAIQILTDNRQKLDELAKYLYQKETITGDEFMEILERE